MGFAVVVEAVGYYLQKHFACVREKWDPPVVITVGSVRLLVEHVDGGVFPCDHGKFVSLP